MRLQPAGDDGGEEDNEFQHSCVVNITRRLPDRRCLFVPGRFCLCLSYQLILREVSKSRIERKALAELCSWRSRLWGDRETISSKKPSLGSRRSVKRYIPSGSRSVPSMGFEQLLIQGHSLQSDPKRRQTEEVKLPPNHLRGSCLRTFDLRIWIAWMVCQMTNRREP